MSDMEDLIFKFYDSKAPNKTKFMFGDLYKGVKKLCIKEGIDPPYKMREVKKEVKRLVEGGTLDYWSSGSTTYIVRGKLDDSAASGELEDKLD